MNNFNIPSIDKLDACVDKGQEKLIKDYQSNLQSLMNHQKKATQTQGISLLDVNGDIVWADKFTQNLWEMKINSQSHLKNLFTLKEFMIPLSLWQLRE